MLLRGNWNGSAVYLYATNDGLDSAYAIYLPSVCGQRDLYLASTNDVLAVYIALALSSGLRIESTGSAIGDKFARVEATGVIEAIVRRALSENAVLPAAAAMQFDVGVESISSTTTESRASMRIAAQPCSAAEASSQANCAMGVSGALVGKRVKLRELGEVAEMKLSDVASWTLNQFYYVEV